MEGKSWCFNANHCFNWLIWTKKSYLFHIHVQLTTSWTDFFVVAQMSVDLVGFVKLVGVRCGLPRKDRVLLEMDHDLAYYQMMPNPSGLYHWACEIIYRHFRTEIRSIYKVNLNYPREGFVLVPIDNVFSDLLSIPQSKISNVIIMKSWRI